MRESPRTRRLRTDLKALESLRADSSILDFSVPGPMFGGPPEVYVIRFHGRGLYRQSDSSRVAVRDHHELSIQLNASYPRMMPQLLWKTPIFHPNISASGAVCLGGYGTYWVPSVNLDELCEMLWDMVRYQNYDVDSPYNREAAVWAKTQTQYNLPVDARPIRDRLAHRSAMGTRTDTSTRFDSASPRPSAPQVAAGANSSDVSPSSRPGPPRSPSHDEGIMILGDVSTAEVVDAELVSADEPDILFLN